MLYLGGYTKCRAFVGTASVNNDVCWGCFVYFNDMPVKLKNMLCLNYPISVSCLLKAQF